MISFKNKYIGSKLFYANLFTLVLPIIVQQLFTNCASLLDNIMVGGLNTASISAVAIVNQLIFVFNLAIFGGVSGASIFGAQFAGIGDDVGLRETFRFKLIYGVITTVGAILVFVCWGDSLILNFLKSDISDSTEIALSLNFAKEYLIIMLFGLVPFMLVQTYASTLREMGETFSPMVAGLVAIFVNLVLNYILIYGNLGAPKLGVAGAAIGTVISRYIEFFIVFICTHKNKYKFKFIIGAYRSLHIGRALTFKIFKTGSPLLINEILWSLGMTVINQSYSTRGLSAVAAINITSVVSNLFCVIMFAMGSAVSIMVGQQLGIGNKKEAIDISNKLLFCTFILHAAMGIILFLFSSLIPNIYNTEQEVKIIVSQLLKVSSFAITIRALIHVIYFTLRSGGKTFITFLFDSVYTWAIPVPLIFILSRNTNLSVFWLFLIIECVDLIKLSIGLPLLKSGFWANNLIKK